LGENFILVRCTYFGSESESLLLEEEEEEEEEEEVVLVSPG
jgi:hypothetical protein